MAVVVGDGFTGFLTTIQTVEVIKAGISEVLVDSTPA
jgi:hypothetical protein